MSETITSPGPLRRVRRVARLLDSQWVIPGTRFRFGVDAIVGLVPGFGDVVTTLTSLYMIWEGLRLGVPAGGIARMAGNVAIDAIAGAVPLLGDLFDTIYKANVRNLAIIEGRHRPEAMRHPAAILGVFLLILTAAVGLLVVLILMLASALANLAGVS